ncbi:hypothetical protein ACQPXH_00565 [Nocardia sp. CA-135953]|uniref:hypothetical protein n=1 Tax=Nocardia sp. CA-135953 TaxID=3239978 RepID=UPI003D9857A4
MATPESNKPDAVKKARDQRDQRLGCGFLLVLVVGGFLIWGWSNDWWPNTPEQNAQFEKIEQERQVTDRCEDVVRDQLKSPASAKFSDVQIAGNSKEGWAASGYVDAQNSYGAMLRDVWTCTADLSADGKTITAKFGALTPQ